MAISLAASGTLAFAEEAVSPSAATAANPSAAIINQTITHIESAIVEIAKSDFAASYMHLKAARETGAQITGNEELVKKANMLVIQGQISSKKGEVKEATDLLNEALTLYKTM
jgi:hypothetical protein